MKRTGSNINGQNIDLNAADSAAQPGSLSAANHGNPDATYSDPVKAPAYNRRTLGVASVLGVLCASLLAVTLFFTSADDSASPAPKFDAKTVSENTIFAFAQLKPAEFSTASSFYHSVVDPDDDSATPKVGGALAASRNQGAADTSAAQSSSANSARSQCSGAACASPRRAPVATRTEVTVRLYKLGVEKRYSPSQLNCARNKECTAEDGTLLEGAKFALYEGSRVDKTKLKGEYPVGKNGVELTGLQPGSTYTLRELEAPEGYTKDNGDYNLVVSADGAVEWRRSKFSGQLVDNKLYFPNKRAAEIKVKLFKLGVEQLYSANDPLCGDNRLCNAADGTLLEGAKFALYEGASVDETKPPIKEYTVGKGGVELTGMQAGKTYTLQETQAPKGYELNSGSYTLRVNNAGKVEYSSDKALLNLNQNNEFYIPNQKKADPVDPEVWLYKLGVADLAACTWGTCSAATADSELLDGAEFALYEGTQTFEDKRVGDAFTVGAQGLKIPGLQSGKTYTLKETKAPQGYLINTETYTFEVDADGKAKYQTDNGSQFFADNKMYVPNQKVAAAEPEVWLYKLGVKKLTDCTWGTCSEADGVVIGDARFALYEGPEVRNANKVGDNFTVGVDGLKIPGLQVGKTYTLQEVLAPQDYVINTDIYTFEVDADGKAKYQTDNGSAYFTDNKIYFPNEKEPPPTVTVKLFKLGVTDNALYRQCSGLNIRRVKACSAPADGELIEGATIALYKDVEPNEANKVGEYTVGKDGVELPGLQEGTYTLKEKVAPSSYKLDDAVEINLIIDADGKASFKHKRSKTVKAPLNNNEFYFPNLKEPVQEIAISLNKVSDKDTPLENVKFDLYEADNPTKPAQNITTGNDGKANLTVTPGRKYRLVETATAPGYALLPQEIKFQVETNGTVTIDKGNGNVNTVTGGDKTLKVVNYPEGKLPLSGHAGSLQVLLIGLTLLLAAVSITLFERKRN